MALVTTTTSMHRLMSREVGPAIERADRTQSTMLKNSPVKKTAIKIRQPARRRDFSFVRKTYNRNERIGFMTVSSMKIVLRLDRHFERWFQYSGTIFPSEGKYERRTLGLFHQSASHSSAEVSGSIPMFS